MTPKYAVEKIEIFPFKDGMRCIHIETRDGPTVILSQGETQIEIPWVLPEDYWMCNDCDSIIAPGLLHACKRMLEKAEKRKEVLEKAQKTYGEHTKEMLGDCDNCDYKKNAEEDPLYTP